MMHFFDYELPERLIAQQPAPRRDESRLLVLHRGDGRLEHLVFRDLPELLAPGDLLVINDTRVLPARLIGHRDKTGGQWEALFLNKTADGLWEMLAKTRGHPVSGEAFIAEGGLRLILRGRTDEHHWLMAPDAPGEPDDLLVRFGQVPLPPYIRRGRAESDDAERYQTVYAEKLGSVAAPTAGLHFTPELLGRLQEKGIANAGVTLHVGLGTFAPVKVDDPAKHAIHREWCEVTAATCEAIRACRERGGRVIAVGTTATRTLETARMRPFRGETDLYIRPPFDFRVVEGLITNFHLPRTTLLLLVGAFAGSDLLRRAYEEAIRHAYRFYSYGDAMLVL
ncbi:MAG TPA: tRNA preQ1(34) S-adenosylmethionine ribosyltransferase-isomerase QueA [Urbifossiella sp.]|nr:tRNA preQ1(34) S-adenosylmethionine ribosyltransferase-isomerase QueA [Urbifossiella sp.]